MDKSKFITGTFLHFKDGKLFIQKTVYKNGNANGIPTMVDVTNDVAKAISNYLKEG